MKPNSRVAFAFAHDVAACALAWMFAFWLRFNLEIPKYYAEIMLESLVWVLPLHVVAFWVFGLYRGIWRFASLPDLRRILLAVGVAAIAVPTLLFMMQIVVPRSVLIMTPVFLAMIMGGSRIAYRAWKERSLSSVISVQREPVFVLGSADAAVNLIKDLARSSQWRVAGIFAEDATLVGRQLHGINVLGRLDDVATWREKMSVLHGIIAMPEASHGARRQALEICTRAGLQVLTVPSYDDLVSGRVTISQLRHVELDDLLGRDPVSLDAGRMREWLHSRPVLVTGAGGSIGAELCRQIARFEPSQLVLFELNEFALYTIEQEFGTRYPNLPLACTIGDVKDAARVAQVIQQFRPAVIFHAAAYKHVPLMESDNAWEAVLNNVTGTEVVARAAIAHGVEKFVFISTDKAVNPTSVMGASKRLAELVCQALQHALPARGGEASTRFVVVRFGNVLGSTGSVIPKFREQIAGGGPITVTHPEVTRYFMSIPEAVQLVLQAGLMGKGGEIFVLDMGEPVKIADLARDLIKLSGYTEEDIKIAYTGLRPGEKLYEEPLAADENTLPTPHPKLKIAQARPEDEDWLQELDSWLARGDMPGTDTVKSDLAKWVPEYSGR
ncbi:MAG: polysaccharide biosynthesis protein [Betaproteobacteria bacterium]|nr:polysaccharide biosynthesis protein [Betaproteobacteria bacterium]MDH3436661.1 polysaccharide biosynthesis protein [Betaproteobacteria bacterium]